MVALGARSVEGPRHLSSGAALRCTAPPPLPRLRRRYVAPRLSPLHLPRSRWVALKGGHSARAAGRGMVMVMVDGDGDGGDRRFGWVGGARKRHGLFYVVL